MNLFFKAAIYLAWGSYLNREVRKLRAAIKTQKCAPNREDPNYAAEKCQFREFGDERRNKLIIVL